jgi:flagellar motor switch protein FliG
MGFKFLDESTHENKVEIHEEFWAKIKDKESMESESIKKFNLIIENYHFTEMQIINKELEMSDIITVIKGLSENAIKNFIQNMSKPTEKQIMKDYLNVTNISESDVIAAQNRILEKINELKEKGDIN